MRGLNLVCERLQHRPVRLLRQRRDVQITSSKNVGCIADVQAAMLPGNTCISWLLWLKVVQQQSCSCKA